MKTAGEIVFQVSIYPTLISKFQRFAENSKLIRSSYEVQPVIILTHKNMQRNFKIF